MPPSGIASASCTLPTSRSRPRSWRRSPSGPFRSLARSRHRHRPYARAVRAAARTRARFSISRSTCLRSRARGSTAWACATAACARAISMIWRCRGIPSTGHHPPGAALLDDGGRAIEEAARVLRPGGRLLVVDFAPHDLEFLRDEHAHRRLGFAPEAVATMDERRRPLTWRRSARSRPRRARATRSRFRSGSAATHVSRSPSRWPPGRLHERASSKPLRPVGQAPHPRLVRVLPAEDRRDGEDAVGVDHAAGAAVAQLRLGHLWGRRLDPRAHPRDRQPHPQRDCAHAGRASHLRGRHLRRDR